MGTESPPDARQSDNTAMLEFERGKTYRVVWNEDGAERTATEMFLRENHPWFGDGFAFTRTRRAGGVFVVPKDALISGEYVRG